MQKVSFTPKTPRLDSEGVINRINILSDKFRENGDAVIFIQHEGSKEGYWIFGTEEWEILSTLVIKSSDLIISKTANDSFYNTTLKDNLLKLGVDKIVITGCATDFCVDSTVKSALINDFNVTIISNGHTTSERPNLTAKQVIDHYNWVWTELTPTKGKIEVIDFNNYLKNE